MDSSGWGNSSVAVSVRKIIQWIHEDENFRETCHMLERESGVYFDQAYFKELGLRGECDKMENYISGFITAVDSPGIFFLIRKLKYLDALLRGEDKTAFDILTKDLSQFYSTHEKPLKNLAQTLILKNLSERKDPHYKEILFDELMELIFFHPLFKYKLNLGSKPSPCLSSGSGSTLVDVAPSDQLMALAQVLNPSQIKQLSLPPPPYGIPLGNSVVGLLYKNAGDAILAVRRNSVLKIWEWTRHEATLEQSEVRSSKELILEEYPEGASAFLPVAGNGLVVLGKKGSIYLLTMETLKTCKKLEYPATVVCFFGKDMIALGSKYGGIHICCYHKDCFESHVKGHRGRVTGLVFSEVLKIFVSAGDDSKLCVWSPQEEKRCRKKEHILKKMTSKDISVGSNASRPTRVQFDKIQKHVFAVQAKQIAIYGAPDLNLVNRWLTPDESTLIVDFSLSSNENIVYIAFQHGIVGMLTGKDEWGTIEMSCLIDVNAYCPRTRPLVIAGHPFIPNQFAVGLFDGGVRIVEHDIDDDA